MVLYRVTVYSRMPDFPLEGEWSNTFHFNLGSKSLAADAGEDAAAIMAIQSPQYAEVFKVVAQQPGGLASSPVIRNISVPGLLDIDPTLRLPLFNAVRVTLTDDVDKPTVMYFRPPLNEGQIESGVLTTAYRDSYQTDVVTQLLGLAGIRSNDDSAFTTGVVYSGVQMRQRGWQRRSRPGFHRGWVPD
jgi:hypothetical protein